MSENGMQTVARSTLPLLVTLLAARKQARWQWANCADEHKHTWTEVIRSLDHRIEMGEHAVGNRLGIEGFRAKRSLER